MLSKPRFIVPVVLLLAGCPPEGEVVDPVGAWVAPGPSTSIVATTITGEAPLTVVVRALNDWGAAVPTAPTDVSVDGVSQTLSFDASGYGAVRIDEIGVHTVAAGNTVAAIALDEASPTERDVIGAFAGLRPLVAPPEDASPSQTSREEEIFESPSGLLSLGGGKLTTYRSVAEKVVDRVVERLRVADPNRRFASCATVSTPLPGARIDMPGRGGYQGFAKRLRATAPSALDEKTMRHLLGRYGSCAPEIVALLASDPAAASKLVPTLPYRRGEVPRAASAELAMTIDDIMQRRLRLTFRDPAAGLDIVEEVAAMMGSVHGWSRDEIAAAVERYRTGVESERKARTTRPAGTPTRRRA